MGTNMGNENAWHKGRAKPNMEPGGFSRPQITCKITNYHRPIGIGRVLHGLGISLVWAIGRT
jgi:hypothetical protein